MKLPTQPTLSIHSQSYPVTLNPISLSTGAQRAAAPADWDSVTFPRDILGDIESLGRDSMSPRTTQ
uniref:Uncharacterized protein n=1 Tax=Oryza glumipatula TaxID=40148 RepID=A0A0D9YLR2_9ORYZ